MPLGPGEKHQQSFTDEIQQRTTVISKVGGAMGGGLLSTPQNICQENYLVRWVKLTARIA